MITRKLALIAGLAMASSWFASQGLAAEGPKRNPVIALSPDGKTLATGSWDGTIKLHDVEKGIERHQLQAGVGPEMAQVSAQIWWPKLLFSPDGKTLASHRANEGIHLWDVAQGRKKTTLPSHADYLSFSPTSNFLAVAENYHGDPWVAKLTIWEVATGKKVASFTEKGQEILSVTFSPQGKSVALALNGREGNFVKLRDIASGKETASIKGKYAAVTRNGKTIVIVGNPETFTLLDLETGTKQEGLKAMSAR